MPLLSPDGLLGRQLTYSAIQAFFTVSPASTAVPSANATSPPSPTSWLFISSAVSAPRLGIAPGAKKVVARADVI